MAIEEKNQFVLYQYLMFFWKKKLWFIIITIITMIVCTLVVKIVAKTSPYDGNSTVFVGSINKPSLTDPMAVQANYGKNLKSGDSLTVVVGDTGYLYLKVSGKNKQNVQDDLNTVTTDLTNDLLSQYNAQRNDTIAYINALKQYTNSLANLNPSLVQNSNDSNSLNSTQQIAIVLPSNQSNQAAIGNATQAWEKSQNDLTNFKKPALLTDLSHAVTHGKSYLKPSLLIGLILGILFSFGILILWKYMTVARKAI